MDDRGNTARSRGVVAAICGIALAGGIATSAAGAVQSTRASALSILAA